MARPAITPRRCSACKRTAPDAEFYPTARTGRCKTCWREYMRSRYVYRRPRAAADLATLTAAWGRK